MSAKPTGGKVRVEHSGGAYDVALASLSEISIDLPADCRIVTDKTVAQVAGDLLRDRTWFAVEPGEPSKGLETFGELLRWLAATNASRKTTVVAVGGGVVGDLAGFVASAYMRGVPFVQVPTTLLAMVDSSVGGKVGIDLPEGKNLAGAFKAPDAVYVPMELIASLPERQFRNGMAEVLKTGFIMDAALSDRLDRELLTPQSEDLESVVLKCIRHKAQVVREDEFETKGIRATLNFGHTIGHAIEYAYRYGELLHGEAISIGMVLEARLGESLGETKPGTAARVTESLRRYGLPTELDPTLSPDKLLEAMGRDKKAVAGSLAFSLLPSIGRCKLIRDVPREAVQAVLARA